MSELKKVFEGIAYQPQEETYYDDGREIELLHFIYSHPHLDDMRGNPRRVLDAIDEFGKTRKYLMNIGEYKSKTVTDLIRQEKPQIMVELGGYVGYSAIAFGAALKDVGGKSYYSLEMNPEFAAVVTMLIDLSGLSDIVKVVIGPSSDSLERLFTEGILKHIDLLFLDHSKPAYTTDLKLCEELGLVSTGSIYAADNVVKPGNPPYLNQFIEGWEPSGVPVSHYLSPSLLLPSG
ncbi:S-adenosyl-L-methionine-dependent methyltransferase [Jackrogersella minutella]|nr:S-adenosyl-L-methionine-dependent methyltransferase [Jackrogersella minutella]